MTSHLDASIAAAVQLLARQHGAGTDRQLHECGLSAGVLRRLIRQGHLLRHGPGVVVDAASPPTWHRRAMAATLAPGADAVLVGAASGRLHELDGCADIERIIIGIPHGSRVSPAAGVTVVKRRTNPPDDITVVDGIRTLTVAATLVDLARVRHQVRAQALEGALRDGASPIELRRTFERLRRPGATGPAEMIAMLDERVDARLPRSWFQTVAAALLSRHGIDTVAEYPVRDATGRLRAELDLDDIDAVVAEFHAVAERVRRARAFELGRRELGA